MAKLSAQHRPVWTIAAIGTVLSLGILIVLTAVWGVAMARPLPIRVERREVIATVAHTGVVVASPSAPDGTAPFAAQVNLGSVEAAAVHPGAEATLASPTLPETVLHGRVTQVTQMRPPAAPWPVYQVLVHIRPPARAAAAGEIQPGLAVAVVITVGRLLGALAAPNDALVRPARGEFSVAALRRGKWRMLPVRVGLRGDHYTQIRRGLREGEIVRLTPGVPGAR